MFPAMEIIHGKTIRLLQQKRDREEDDREEMAGGSGWTTIDRRLTDNNE
jgi:hypothetical protein